MSCVNVLSSPRGNKHTKQIWSVISGKKAPRDTLLKKSDKIDEGASSHNFDDILLFIFLLSVRYSNSLFPSHPRS